MLGNEPPPVVSQDSQMRPWFRNNSLVLAPSTHPVHEELRRSTKSKKYGRVVVPAGAPGPDEWSVLDLVRRSMEQLREFVGEKLPHEEEDEMEA